MKRSVANAKYLSGLTGSRKGYYGGGAPSLSQAEVDELLGGPSTATDLGMQGIRDQLANPAPITPDKPWYGRAYDAVTGSASSAAQNYARNLHEEDVSSRNLMSQWGRPANQILGAAQYAMSPIGAAFKSVEDLMEYATANPEFAKRFGLVSSLATPGNTRAAARVALPRRRGGRALAYPLRDKSKWSKHERYQQTGGKIKQMSPSEFLSETQKMDMDKGDKKHIKRFKKKMKKGEELNPLALFPSGGQDGRHRAAAAKALKIAKVPVITWPGRK